MAWWFFQRFQPFQAANPASTMVTRAVTINATAQADASSTVKGITKLATNPAKTLGTKAATEPPRRLATKATRLVAMVLLAMKPSNEYFRKPAYGY